MKRPVGSPSAVVATFMFRRDGRSEIAILHVSFKVHMSVAPEACENVILGCSTFMVLDTILEDEDCRRFHIAENAIIHAISRRVNRMKFR